MYKTQTNKLSAVDGCWEVERQSLTLTAHLIRLQWSYIEGHKTESIDHIHHIKLCGAVMGVAAIGGNLNTIKLHCMKIVNIQ